MGSDATAKTTLSQTSQCTFLYLEHSGGGRREGVVTSVVVVVVGGRDDSDFSEMLRRARDSNLGTVVVGDWHRALGRHADLWVPWIEVENGEISEENLVPRSRWRSEFIGRDDGTFSITHFDEEINGEENLDSIMDELVMVRTDFNTVRISAFSEKEDEEEEDWMGEEMNRKRNVQLQMGQSLDDDDDDDFSLDSEDEESETEEDDMYS
ncbi:hypothetical protein F0562_033374 [Nyssa sinensis]|uniref:Uncharacterized protein n=1 Tax=Nyssa sinensis TaxID=561372 RepID=A0A5J5AQ15_9ASTE|nr:hypothetical protein F0562_033374 [Nyssa sinensis]